MCFAPPFYPIKELTISKDRYLRHTRTSHRTLSFCGRRRPSYRRAQRLRPLPYKSIGWHQQKCSVRVVVSHYRESSCRTSHLCRIVTEFDIFIAWYLATGQYASFILQWGIRRRVSSLHMDVIQARNMLQVRRLHKPHRSALTPMVDHEIQRVMVTQAGIVVVIVVIFIHDTLRPPSSSSRSGPSASSRCPAPRRSSWTFCVRDPSFRYWKCECKYSSRARRYFVMYVGVAFLGFGQAMELKPPRFIHDLHTLHRLLVYTSSSWTT